MVQKHTAEDWDFNIPFTTRARRGGGVLPITAYTRRLRPKGYLFQASRDGPCLSLLPLFDSL